MANYEITLPEQTYHRLLEAAQKEGISPAHWIATQLPTPSPQPPLSTLLTGLIGAIDSKTAPHDYPKKTTAFGEGIATKLAKQGIHLP